MKARIWPVAIWIIALVAIPETLPAQTSSSDPVPAWNELALKTARVKSLNDARAARLYAMVNAAIYDAVNGIVSRLGEHAGRQCALIGEGCVFVPPTPAPPQGNLAVAASAAAHAVLAGEFPDLAAGFPDFSPGYDAQLESDLIAGGAEGRNSAGHSWGTDVGGWVRAVRVGDSPTVSQPPLPGPTPGKYQAATSGVNLAPFAIADPTAYRGPGPKPLDSLEYAGAFAEVKLIGNRDIPDAGLLATSRFWSLGGGTSQPPGAWIQIALAITADNALPLPEMARLLTLLSMANADTVGATTLAKAYYRHWRPTAAIQEAGTDGNVWTEPDSWTQRGTAAASPEHYSGHSAFGGAGAAALAGFFCDDEVSFSILTDSGANFLLAARTYASFSAAGAEMGRSRVAGGLHFQFSNEQGIAAGRAIASEVLANKLLRRSGATHFGACPR